MGRSPYNLAEGCSLGRVNRKFVPSFGKSHEVNRLSEGCFDPYFARDCLEESPSTPDNSQPVQPQGTCNNKGSKVCVSGKGFHIRVARSYCT
jgi:hypothetical protein